MLNSPHSHSLRKGRVSEPGRIYLVTFTTEKRRPIFECFRLGRLVVNELRHSEIQRTVLSLAWVVMPDHVHWLLELNSASLGRLMKQVKARSACAVNRATGSSGPVWQQGFHDRALRRDDDLVKAARYIVLNPVRAGLVRRVGEYPLWDAVWL